MPIPDFMAKLKAAAAARAKADVLEKEAVRSRIVAAGREGEGVEGQAPAREPPMQAGESVEGPRPVAEPPPAFRVEGQGGETYEAWLARNPDTRPNASMATVQRPVAPQAPSVIDRYIQSLLMGRR